MSRKLSATIITLNEEKNIERCLISLRDIVDEVIVLDSFSEDRTVEICKSMGAIVVQRKWEGYAASKNFVNSLAKHDYIFSIDADESLDSKLQKAILEVKKSGFTDVYAVNRLTNYCGKWIKYSGWHPDIKTRIFPKERTKWAGAYVHEELEIEGAFKTILLEGNLLHYSYYNFNEHRVRADKYSALTAKKMAEKGKKASLFKPYLSGLGRFIAMFLLKKGFLDGKMGFKIALISAQSNIFKYKELRKINREQRNRLK